jgi:hypothetical protein
MNAIMSMASADFYLDSSRNARYYFSQYNRAFNDAINAYMDAAIGDTTQRDPENFQWIQQIRDNLFNLITVVTPTATNGTVVTNEYYSSLPSHIDFPADYYDFVLLMLTIDGYTKYSKPTTYNEIGPLLDNSFKHPTNLKTYYNENSDGLTIWRGVTGSITTASLTYIRTPVDFSIGAESDLIDQGSGVLTIGTSYIATEVSVENGITYQIGDQFLAGTVNLTSGQVIPFSVTSPVDLPDKAHSEIAKAAARIMLLATSNYNAAQAVDSEVQRS